MGCKGNTKRKKRKKNKKKLLVFTVRKNNLIQQLITTIPAIPATLKSTNHNFYHNLPTTPFSSIQQLKKTKIPYRKLTDKDKEILIDALKNYYYIMNTILNMGGDSVYSIDKHKKKIIKNIEKIKAL